MDSYTGRSMDPLVPTGELSRKKTPDIDYDVTQRYRGERQRPHVCSSDVCLRLISAQCSSYTGLLLAPLDIILIIFPGASWGVASRAPFDPAATKSSSTVCPGPELASPAWETHLWILRLRSKCTFFSFLFNMLFLNMCQIDNIFSPFLL